jgi:hypothetical protein
MFFVGIDLHKKTITVCLVNQERAVVKCRSLKPMENQTGPASGEP